MRTVEEKSKRHSLVGPTDWKARREFQIEFVKNAMLLPNHKFLDIGCGTLRGGIPIIDYLNKGNYYGFDVRINTIEEGRKELKDEGLENKNPTLVCRNSISTIKFDTKFDFIWAFSVLIHLDNESLTKTFKFVSENLSDDGVFYANVKLGDKKDGKWKMFELVWRSLEFYKKQASSFGLVVEDVGSFTPITDYVNRISQPPKQQSSGSGMRMLKIYASLESFTGLNCPQSLSEVRLV